MEPKVLIITDRSDIAETQLIIGLARRGIAVTVMANETGPNFPALEASGLSVIPLRLSGRFDRRGTRVIRRELMAGGYTVIYAFNPRAIACGLRASRRMGVGVMGYRGVIGNAGIMKPESWFTFLHPRLDRIVCVSNAVQRYFESLGVGPFRLPKGKAITIYKGHNLSWYDKPVADLTEFRFPPEAFVYVCVGRDRPGKGFTTLVEALAQIPPELAIHLLLVGDLENNERLKAQIREAGLESRVKFAGYRTDAPQVTGACDALVLPSESEGLPRVVIEAMAYERPVVVTDAGGMPELVEHGVEGLVVPVRDPQALANAMMQLALDRPSAKAMGRRGRARIERDFTSEVTIDKTISVVRELSEARAV